MQIKLEACTVPACENQDLLVLSTWVKFDYFDKENPQSVDISCLPSGNNGFSHDQPGFHVYYSSQNEKYMVRGIRYD